MGLVGLKTLSNIHEISVTKLRKLIKKGLPHYRENEENGKILVDNDEFIAWFKTQYLIEKPSDLSRLDQAVTRIIEDFKGK